MTTFLMSSTQQVVSVDCRISSDNATVVLPPISNVRATPKFIKKIGADTSVFTVLIQPASGDKLEGVVNGTMTLVNPGDSVQLIPGVNGWQLWESYGPVGSGAGISVNPPGDVTIISVDVIDATPDANGNAQKLWSVNFTPPSPIGSFVGGT